MAENTRGSSLDLSRRTVMKSVGAGALLTGLAGCLGDETGEGGHFVAGAPESGAAALPGGHVMSGMELRYQEMEENEEFDEIPEGLFENSECSAETATGYTTDAVARHDDLFAWLGGYCSPETLATMGTTEEEGMLQIVTSFAPEVTETGHPYTFRAAPKSGVVVPPAVEYAFEELDGTQHAILGLNNDWGIDETEEWESQVQDRGGEIVYNELFPGDQGDFTSEATQIAGSDPDVIFALGYHGSTANILQSIHEQGMTAGEDVEIFIGTVAGFVLSGAVQNEHIENVYTTNYYMGPGFENYPEGVPDHMVDFQEKYEEEYGENTIRESAVGYTLVEAMIQAMHEVDGEYHENVDEMAEGLRDRDDGFMTPFGEMVFDETGQAEIPIFIAQHNEDGEMFVVQDPQ